MSVPCERRHRIKACIIGRSGRVGEGFLSDGRTAKLAATEIEWPTKKGIRRARAAPFFSQGRKKGGEGGRFVEPNPLLLFGFGREKIGLLCGEPMKERAHFGFMGRRIGFVRRRRSNLEIFEISI